MTTPAFFDAIHYGKAPLATFAENYFFLEGISGRLGFHRYSVLSKTNHTLSLQLLPSARIQAKDLLQTILKIISYITLILPAVIFAVKGAFRLKHSFTIAKLTLPPQAHPDARKAQLFLDDLWKGYKKLRVDDGNVRPLFSRLREIEDEKNNGGRDGCSITPGQDPMGNLLRSFDSDLEVLIEPKVYRLDKQEDIQSLLEVLKAAFATGRRLVGVQLEHPTYPHALAAAVSNDGHFRIIDSCSDVSVDMNKLTQQFNAACIPDSAGRPLKFQGEFINTHLQKGTNECIRFATLYLYQILKKRDLNAFEEVNGAFADGKLKRFEDYATIGSSRRLRDASGVPAASYEPFMLSWAHRCKGLSVDRWQDVTLQDIISIKAKVAATAPPEKQANGTPRFGVRLLGTVNWDICTIGKETFHIREEQHEGKLPLFIRDAAGNEKPITPDFLWSPQTRLGELVPAQKGMHTVILHDAFAGSNPIVLKLQPGENLFARWSRGIEQICPT